MVLSSHLGPVASETGQLKNVKTLTIDRMVHLAAPGPNDSRYAYVPFEVPSGATRMKVSYQYERAGGANTIDIGIFDARLTNSVSHPKGFRGWSGGRRSEFFISRDEATPGYLPGEIHAGTWQIILGLYSVAPAGVDVSLKVELETGKGVPSTAERTITKSEGASSEPQRAKLNQGGRVGKSIRWWRGDLHMHTIHSDGDWTVAELINSARERGLDFICITEHNTSSHHAEIAGAGSTLRPLVLRGEEITTYGGHANAFGLPAGTWIDFRVTPKDVARISSVAAEVHKVGALISINHPFGHCGGCSWGYDSAIQNFDAIEIWNGPWDLSDELAVKMWDKLLQSGQRITAIASSDSHRSNSPLGQPTTSVGASNLSQSSVLEAIRRGHVYLTSEIERPQVRFEAQPESKPRLRRTIGDEVYAVAGETVLLLIVVNGTPPDATTSLISNGEVIRNFAGQPTSPIRIKVEKDTYFRMEVRDKNKTMLALTNPIFVKVKRTLRRFLARVPEASSF